MLGLTYVCAGIVLCLTIIGIPAGVQCFKLAGLSFFPFGKEIEYGGKGGSTLLNILWLLTFGLPLAIESAVFGLVCYITIIGIPFGKQYMKLAKLSLMPFGAIINYK